jgi:hypothetical protein
MAYTAHTLLPMFLLGVLAMDLMFDIGGLPPAYTVMYYAGIRTANFPANASIIVALIVGFVPYIRDLKQGNYADITSFAILLVGTAIFGGYLIPVAVRRF